RPGPRHEAVPGAQGHDGQGRGADQPPLGRRHRGGGHPRPVLQYVRGAEGPHGDSGAGRV
ncbi:Ribokinase, partial [Dysosmobacter welbionis]